MKKMLPVIVAVLGFALPASGLDVKAITARPTADNPQFKNKKAWPMLVGDEYFLKQKWEKGRTYVWNVQKSIEADKNSRRRGGADGCGFDFRGFPASFVGGGLGAHEFPRFLGDQALEGVFVGGVAGVDKRLRDLLGRLAASAAAGEQRQRDEYDSGRGCD